MAALKHPFAAGLARLSALAVDLLMPPLCPVCRGAVSDADALCARCWSEIRFIAAPFCAVYGTPFPYAMGEGAVSAAAIADPPPFRRARAAALYGDGVRRLVHQLKYQDRPDLAVMLARSMARIGGELLAEADLIVPVPLHRWRLWQRRFNQAALLGVELARLSGVRCEPLALQRPKASRQQVGLNAAQRAANVQGAFRVPPEQRPIIAGRNVLLVDDVYTSGATAKAATRGLLRGGAAAVDVLTFARVAG